MGFVDGVDNCGVGCVFFGIVGDAVLSASELITLE